MALPLPRWCNAVMAWIRQRYLQQGEEGQMRWRQVEEYVTTPPQRPATPEDAGARQAGPRAAMMSAEQEAAAFEAFAAVTGG